MKKTVFLSLVIILTLFSCNTGKEKFSNKSSNSKKAEKIEIIDTVKLKIDSAKMFLDSAHFFVEKSIKGEMSVTVSNNISGPLMKNFFRIYKSLPDADTLLLHKYRVRKVNELIDLQIKYNN